MPELVLVTGATDGIGQQTALDLVRGGARVVIHGRSDERLAATKSLLDAEARGLCAGTVKADLSRLDEVRAMARDVQQRFPQVDVLLNNAGIYPAERWETADGFEATFAINHLAPFLLTHLLLPQLRRQDRARIINVASIAHTRGRLHRSDPGLAECWDPYKAYAQSKLCNVLFTRELARRLGPVKGRRDVPRVYALHPGVVDTKLLRTGFDIKAPDSLKAGAATSVWLAVADEVSDDTGWYYMDCARVPVHSSGGALAPQALDTGAAAWLYDESCRWVDVAPLSEPG